MPTAIRMCPFERLVEQLNPDLHGASSAVSGGDGFPEQCGHPEVVAIDGVSVEQLAVFTRTAKYDLDFDLSEVPSRGAGRADGRRGGVLCHGFV